MNERDATYYAGLSAAVEAGNYRAAGPVEFGPAVGAMRLSLIVLYIPEPSLDRAARFYGALLGVEPVQEQHGVGPVHYSITSAGTGLTIELYPAATRPPTSTRLEWRGSDAKAAVERLIEAHAAPEPHGSGGWWATDPAGNTVVLLGIDAAVATANRRRAAEIIGRPLPVSGHEAELYRAEGMEPPEG